MIRRPPRSTLDRSSAASDVYKRQLPHPAAQEGRRRGLDRPVGQEDRRGADPERGTTPVSYTHLRAHETVLDLVCRLLLEKKKNSMRVAYITYFKLNYKSTCHRLAIYST